MRLSRFGSRCGLCAALIAFVSLAGADAGGEKQPKNPEQARKVEEAIRALHADMASPNEEVRLKALKRHLPDKKDIERLFPRHVDTVWPLYEAENQKLLKHLPELTREFTKHGPLVKVKLHNVRDEKEYAKHYAKVFQYIPATIAVYEDSVSFKDGSAAGGGTYAIVSGRVLMLLDLASIPEIIEKPKKNR